MNSERFSGIVRERIASIESVLNKKAAEYSSDTDRLYNFKVAARVNETSAEVALWGMFSKHLVSVMDLVSGRLAPRKEVVDEKIGDAINYLILLEALLEEKRHA